MTLPTTRIDTMLSPPPLGGHSGQGQGHSLLHPHPGNGGSPSPSCTTGSEDSTQQILLVDFPSNLLQNGGGSSESPGTPGSGPYQNLVPSGALTGPCHSVQLQQPMPMSMSVNHNLPLPNHVNHRNPGHFANDLSNFTLVNLTNPNDHEGQGGQDEDEEEDSGGEGRPMIPQSHQRNSIPNAHFLPRRGSGGISGYPTSAAMVGGHQGQNQGQGRGHNHVGRRLSSSLSSSSDDSDTGFLVHGRSHNGVGSGVRRNNPYRLQKQSLNGNAGDLPGQGSPTGQSQSQGLLGANQTGFLQGNGQGNTRKRLKRKRSTVRRKSSGSRPLRGESMEASDLFPICCCFGDEQDPRQGQGQGSSLISRYLRLSCFIVMIIFIATFISIMVSLQRKVDSLSLEVNKLSAPSGGLNDLNPSSGAGIIPPDQKNATSAANGSNSQMQELFAKIASMNSTFATFTGKLAELSEKVSNLEKQPSIEELRTDLAQLGSEMKGSIEEVKNNLDLLKKKVAEDELDRTMRNNVPGQGQGSGGANPGDNNNVPNNIPQKLAQIGSPSPVPS